MLARRVVFWILASPFFLNGIAMGVLFKGSQYLFFGSFVVLDWLEEVLGLRAKEQR